MFQNATFLILTVVRNKNYYASPNQIISSFNSIQSSPVNTQYKMGITTVRLRQINSIINGITKNNLFNGFINRNFKSVQHCIKLIRYDVQYFNLNVCAKRTDLTLCRCA